MKKTLFTLFTAISFALLYCPAALALTEDEAAAAVGAQGKDAVSGNLFLWLLCGRDDRLAAALLLGGLGATDWVDVCLPFPTPDTSPIARSASGTRRFTNVDLPTDGSPTTSIRSAGSSPPVTMSVMS